MAEKQRYLLEIEGPLVTCGQCRFTSAFSGTFAVEKGQLTWRGDSYLTRSRGPDIGWCSECGTVLSGISADGTELSPEQVRALEKRTDDVLDQRP